MDKYSILVKANDESEDVYVWRCHGYIREGRFENWREITPYVNEQLGHAYDESTYRKKCQYAERLYNEVFSKEQSGQYLDDLREATLELEKERIRVRDERTQLNVHLRALARCDSKMDYLTEMVKQYCPTPYNAISIKKQDCEMAMIAMCTDWHIGKTFANFQGQFNSDIARQRVVQYASEIIKTAQRYDIHECYVAVLGDMINGIIHNSVRVENNENVIQQIMIAADILTEFVYHLSYHFSNIHIISVPGNHTRLFSNKNDTLCDERLDDLIVWYAKAKLNNNACVDFLDSGTGTTIQTAHILGHDYAFVHGDYDSRSGVNKLANFMGYVPDYVCCGHEHHGEFDETTGLIRGGSLSGAGDSMSIEIRAKGKASQMCVICDTNGVKALMPIVLE